LLTDVRVIVIDQNLAKGAADSAGKLVRTVSLEDRGTCSGDVQ
jgi:hypothetical protein